MRSAHRLGRITPGKEGYKRISDMIFGLQGCACVSPTNTFRQHFEITEAQGRSEGTWLKHSGGGGHQKMRKLM